MRIVDLIYPPRCICCFEVVKNNALTCDECAKELSKQTNYIEYRTPVLECRSLYRYEDCVRGVIKNIKWRKSITVCKKIGGLLADEAEKMHAQTPFDLIVYVPMTRKDRIRRGFNQCEMFARVISKRLGLKFEKNTVKKIRQTDPQKGLKAAERAKNLKGAFRVEKNVDGKSILLVDDVITTGTTLKENARMLYKAGARRVTALTFAKA